MDLSQIASLRERVRRLQNHNVNEAETKNSLVLPFIQALGYDIFNPLEVAAEYTCDFATKKGEKIDFAILKDGQPSMLIECKPLGDPLDVVKSAQLFRYFITQPCKIGILTDGCRYLFFSDLDKENIMDDTPFMEINLTQFNEKLLPELQKLSKEQWNINEILNSAAEMRCVNIISKAFLEDITTPSDEIVKFYASLCYGGKMTANAKNAFKPIVKKAFSEAITGIINRRLEVAQSMDEEPTPDKPAEQPHAQQESDNGIVTTNTEMWALVAIRTLLKDVVASPRIMIRDKKTYCGILLDDNNRKPICRLFNFQDFQWGDENIGDNAYVLIFNTEQGEKFPIRFVDDLFALQEHLIAAVKRYL